MEKLTDLPNIGKEIEKQLHAIGVSSYKDLKELGAEQAWLKIREKDASACYNRLLGLEGALKKVKKTMISHDRKAALKEFYYLQKNM